MPAIAYVYFCTDTKQEVLQKDLDTYLELNPTHTLIECIRRADNIVNGQPPFVERLVPDKDEATIQAVSQFVNNGVLTLPGGKSTWMATFAEATLSRLAWVSPGASLADDVGFVAPFDCNLMSVSVAFSQLRADCQSINIVKGQTGSNIVFSTPWYLNNSNTVSSVFKELYISFKEGDVVRCRVADGYGQFKSLVVTALFERITS